MIDTNCPYCHAEKYDNPIPQTDMAGNPFPLEDFFFCGSSPNFRPELCREREAHNNTKRERDEAIIQLENIKASSIHTCHDKCQRPMCVLRRERDELKMQLNATQKNLSSIHQWIERNHPDGFIDSLTCLQNLDRVTDNWYDRYDRLEVDACRFVRERDEAREQVNHYRDKLDLSPISWDI